MKKWLCACLAMLIAFSMVSVCSASETMLMPSMVTDSKGVTVGSDKITGMGHGKYVAFPNVNMDGVNSASVLFDYEMSGNDTGEVIGVFLDSPTSADCLGYLILNQKGMGQTQKTALKKASGTHTVYFVYLLGRSQRALSVYRFALSSETVTKDPTAGQVPDSFIEDNWSDTWVATDDCGRKVADYEEVGAVKTDGREVLMFYWDWRIAGNTPAQIIPELVAAHPEIMEPGNYFSPYWYEGSTYFWNEPALGFYSSSDYWVYRKHAEMLDNIGVDAILFDYTNSGSAYYPQQEVLMQAFRDAKKTGVNVPRISIITWGENAFYILGSAYYNCFVEKDFSDIWYFLDGKPMVYCTTPDHYAMQGMIDKTNAFDVNYLNHMADFFTFRSEGTRNGADGKNEWMWLENFPQVERNVDPATGRAEFMTIGVGINESYIGGVPGAGAFGTGYCKGRGYSEVFGCEANRTGAKKQYFFREQSMLALESAPEIVFVDGWNEYNALHIQDYHGTKNTFVDLFDDENSRDFEPCMGYLKDDTYMLLADFIRKYKGVRPAPVSTGAKTVDIADPASWDGVGPVYYNADQDYERDSYGYVDPKTGENYHYTTTVNNAIRSAKVSFDENKLYFLVNCARPVTEGKNFLTLYLNTDRNYATGWEGYDYAVGISGKGVVSQSDGTWNWTNAGTAETAISGSSYCVAIPRDLIGKTADVELEFKWTDSVDAKGELINFYKDGSVAPYGRFNYLFTQKEQTALSDATRAKLTGTTVIAAGKNRMVTSGGKMYVYEPDIRVTPVEMNGTLYVPEDTFNEILGYGRSKTSYEPFYNSFYVSHFKMSDDLTEVVDYHWTDTVMDSLELHVDGRVRALTAPVTSIDGRIYVPLTFASDCFGFTVTKLSDGVYVIAEAKADMAAAAEAAAHLE